MIPIVEIFGPTLQGEGRNIGHSSYFIRVGGCNFSCKGFGVPYEVNGEIKYGCDTYYAVDKSFKSQWNLMTYEDIVNKLEKLGLTYGLHKPELVITGGEPLLYWNDNDFQNLLAYFISRDIKITIETNASIYIEFNKDYQKEIMFSMSVKLANSGESERKRINIDAITNILENTKNSYFKFVVNKDTNINEIYDILHKISYYADVYLMPMGENKKEIEKNQNYVADLCIKNNFKYSPRLHIDLWGDKRGV